MTTSYKRVIQSLTPDAAIVLFDLDVTALGDTIYHFTSDAGVPDPTTGAIGQISFGGVAYTTVPIFASGFEWSGNGPMPTPKMEVSVVNNPALLAAIITYDGLAGATLVRRKTLRRYLDDGSEPDGTAYFQRDVYRVDRKAALKPKSFAEIELASVADQQGRMLPGRQVLRDSCSFRYRSWVGGRIPSRASTFTGNRTSGSPTLTGVTGMAGLTIGQPISGTGIPVSTTIIGLDSVAQTVTMSANASSGTATSTTVTLGVAPSMPILGLFTASGASGATTLTGASSLTGLAIGMIATQANVSGKITKLSGTTVTLDTAHTAAVSSGTIKAGGFRYDAFNPCPYVTETPPYFTALDVSTRDASLDVCSKRAAGLGNSVGGCKARFDPLGVGIPLQTRAFSGVARTRL